MPTYEYACKSCGRHLDVFRRISDEPLTVCPDCGGELRKVYHPAGILLKGSGFYRTDNRAKSGASNNSESSGTSEKKSDTSSSSSGSSSPSSSSSGSSSGSKEKSA